MDNIFTKIDNYNHNISGFNPIGSLKNISIWRRYIFILTIASAFFWIILGFESTWSQISIYMQSIPAFLIGQTSFTTIQAKVASSYGLGQHLSTAVIYGICFLILSIHLEKSGITKSMNFFFSTSISLMSVGIYEIIYNFLYATLQNQPWAFTLAWKQGLNISVFAFFTIIGAISLIYLYSLNFKPHFSKITLILLFGSIITYALWVFFPFSTTSLAIQTTSGLWTSTNLFPQTMYAINLNPTSGIAIGDAFFVQNNLLHFINVLNKVFVSFTILSLILIRNKQK